MLCGAHGAHGGARPLPVLAPCNPLTQLRLHKRMPILHIFPTMVLRGTCQSSSGARMHACMHAVVACVQG